MLFRNWLAKFRQRSRRRLVRSARNTAAYEHNKSSGGIRASESLEDRTLLTESSILSPPSVLIFADAGLPDYESLVQSVTGAPADSTQIDENTQLILLDPSTDGVTQISDVLAGVDDQSIGSIHILSHGSLGQLGLGSTLLDQAGLQDRADELSSWSRALSEEADILLYGCRVGAGDPGGQFVEQFAELTGADIAASIDDTGSDARGGDWNLEFEFGVIETVGLTPILGEPQFTGLLETKTAVGSKPLTASPPEMGTTGDVLNGTDGKNVLVSGTGDDQLNGKKGDDTYQFENEFRSDTVTDTGGTKDTLDFTRVSNRDFTFKVAADGKVHVATNMATDKVTAPGGTNGIDGIEIVKAPKVSGKTNTLILDGWQGMDNAIVTVKANGDVVVRNGSSTLITLSNIDSITTGPGNDTIIIEKGASLAGKIDGGAGENTLDYGGSTAAKTAFPGEVTVDLSSAMASDWNATNINGGQNGAILAAPMSTNPSIQNVIGGTGKNTINGAKNVSQKLTGSKRDDELTGGEQADELNGAAGDDKLTGGKGDDKLTGGDGNDTYVFQDDWGKDTLAEAANGGKNDTLDFRAVTKKLTVEVKPNGALTVKDDSAPANEVKGAAMSPATEIETIIGGTAENTYQFFDNWAKSFVVENQYGGNSTVDFSNVTKNLTITIEPPGERKVQVGMTQVNEFKDAINKVTVTDGAGHTAVIFNVANLTGGKGNNTYKFKDGAVISGKLLQTPTMPMGTTFGTNVLDYSDFGQPVFANLSDTAQTVQPRVIQQVVTQGQPGQNQVVRLWNDAVGGTFKIVVDVLIEEGEGFKRKQVTTSALAFNATAGQIKTALEAAAYGVISKTKPLTNVEVVVANPMATAGTEANPWTITFVKPNAVAGISIDDTKLLKITEPTPAIVTTAGTVAVSEVRTLSTEATSGKFKLKVSKSLISSATTAEIQLGMGSAADIETNLQTTLNTLYTITDADVSVTGTGVTVDPWVMTFNKPTHISGLSLVDSTLERPADITVTQSADRTTQSIFHDGTTDNFQISLPADAKQAAVGPITVAAEATATDLQTALSDSMAGGFDPTKIATEVAGKGTASDPWTISFFKTKASGSFAANGSTIEVTAKNVGPKGNDISLEFVKPTANDQPLSVSVSPGTKNIVVRLATDMNGNVSSSLSDVVNKLNMEAASSALVTAVAKTPVATALAETSLEGGMNAKAAELLIDSSISADKLKLVAKTAGVGGNDIKFEISDNVIPTAPLGIAVTGKTIEVTLADMASENTIDKVFMAINNNAMASALVTASVVGTGTTTLVAANEQSLTGGADEVAATKTVTLEGVPVTFTSKQAGMPGNSIKIKLVKPAAATGLSVGVVQDISSELITVTLATNASGQVTTTVGEVVTAISGNAEAAALVTTTTPSLGAIAKANLTGGDAKDAELREFVVSNNTMKAQGLTGVLGLRTKGQDATKEVRKLTIPGDSGKFVLQLDGLNQVNHLWTNAVDGKAVANIDSHSGVSLRLVAKQAGTTGNNISVELKDPGADGPLNVAVAGTTITVNLARSGGKLTSTAEEVASAINAKAEASALITATVQGQAIGWVDVAAETNVPKPDASPSSLTLASQSGVSLKIEQAALVPLDTIFVQIKKQAGANEKLGVVVNHPVVNTVTQNKIVVSLATDGNSQAISTANEVAALLNLVAGDLILASVTGTAKGLVDAATAKNLTGGGAATFDFKVGAFTANIPAKGVSASATIEQSTGAKLKFEALEPGVAGNQVSVSFSKSGSNQSLSAVVVTDTSTGAKQIKVSLATDAMGAVTTTTNQLKMELEKVGSSAGAVVKVTVIDDGTKVLEEQPQTNLSGGGGLGDLLTAAGSPIKAATVTGTGVATDPWVITVLNPSGVVPAINVTPTTLGAVADVAISTANNNFVQRIYKPMGVSGGDFRLKYDATHITSAISHNADPATLTRKLRYILPDDVTIKDITGTGSSTDPWIVQFQKHNGSVPALTSIDSTLISGSGSVTLTTPTPGQDPPMARVSAAFDAKTVTKDQLKTAIQGFTGITDVSVSSPVIGKSTKTVTFNNPQVNIPRLSVVSVDPTPMGSTPLTGKGGASTLEILQPGGIASVAEVRQLWTDAARDPMDDSKLAGSFTLVQTTNEVRQLWNDATTGSFKLKVAGSAGDKTTAAIPHHGQASLMINSGMAGKEIRLEARQPGKAGNQIKVKFVKAAAANGRASVAITEPTAMTDPNTIVVTLATDAQNQISSTAASIVELLNADSRVARILTASLPEAAVGTIPELAATNLAGGLTVEEALTDQGFAVEVTGQGTQAKPWLISLTDVSQLNTGAMPVMQVTDSTLMKPGTIKVTASNDPSKGNQVQTITPSAGATGEFTLRYGNFPAVTVTASNAMTGITAMDVETKIKEFSPALDVTVAGNAKGPWTVTFNQPAFGAERLVASNLSLMSPVVAQEMRLVTGTTNVQGVAAAAAINDADSLKMALNKMGLIDVAVTGTGTQSDPWVIKYQDTMGATTFGIGSSAGGEGYSLTTTNLLTSNVLVSVTATNNNKNQVITLPMNASGKFKLSYGGKSTMDIDASATAMDVQTALSAAITQVDMSYAATVAGNAGGPWTVTFTAPTNNVQLLQVDASGLTAKSVSVPGNSITGINAGAAAGAIKYRDQISKLVGSAKDDRLFAASEKPAEFLGGDGYDWLIGADNEDKLFGQEGPDFIEGGKGNDIIQGGPDDDILRGGEGQDQIVGSIGDDDIKGTWAMTSSLAAPVMTGSTVVAG